MHLLFYFITVGGKRSCQGPGLVSGKPLSAFVSLQSLHYWKVPWRREGAPWRDRKQCSVGQQSHFWNHHRSHGLLTFPQSSSGERCFHWTSQGGGCRKVVGTAHPGTHRPPPHPVSTPLKWFTADKNILCLNVTREQRELCFIRTIRNGAITIFLYCPGWGEEIE